MKNKKSRLIYVILAVIVFMGIYFLVSSPESKTKYDSFAQCLTEEGAKMYGTDWCQYCQEQKSRFGKSFKHVDYVNCDFNQAECSIAGVQGYPTWVINGESYQGVQSLSYLSSLTGCELPLE